MTSFYQSINEKVDNTLINIKDFGTYHRYVMSESDPLNVYKLKKLANEKYDQKIGAILD